MPASGRWKMVDNLRRTLSPITCLLALMAGWLLPFDAAVIWTIFVAGDARAAQFRAGSGGARAAPSRASSLRIHFRACASDFRLALLFSRCSSSTFLAHQAWLMGDAITRTLFRLFITRRNLLSGPRPRRPQSVAIATTVAYYRWMRGAVLTGVGGAAAALLSGDQTWLLAAPFAICGSPPPQSPDG